MSNVFISHSSKDNVIASRISIELKALGYNSLFLDFDPDKGIAAGKMWERELYTRLQKSQAVVVVHTRHFAESRWCFAEVTQAKALGKFIIPIKADESPVLDIIQEYQVLDMSIDQEATFHALERGLATAGISKEDWNNDRPPYPGLLAFEEEDAPVYFGRTEDINQIMELCRRFHDFGGDGFALILGASGSGKSSLVKAGVIPALHKSKSDWSIVGPFRPLNDAFKELSKALCNAFLLQGIIYTVDEIYTSLVTDAGAKRGGITKLSVYLQNLREQLSDHAVNILFIDQFEELLVNGQLKKEHEYQTPNNIFFEYIRYILKDGSGKNLIICSLRSDFLINFHENDLLSGFNINNSIIISSISQAGLRASIMGPAKVAGIDFEDGLVETIINDTGTKDALPLMAFIMRKLWENSGKEKILTISAYNLLGGLYGSIAKAAEDVLLVFIQKTKRGEILGHSRLEQTAVLDPADEELLRSIFMTIVRIDEEGRYSRKWANRNEWPKDSRMFVDLFIKARLLISSGDGKVNRIEVAHESLFRTWGRLAKWLEEDRNFLIWKRRLDVALQDWEMTGKGTIGLLQEPTLGESLKWFGMSESGRYRLENAEVGFIKNSLLEEQKTRIQQERKRAREVRNLRVALISSIITIIAISFIVYYIVNTNRAEKNRLSAYYWNLSLSSRDSGKYELALLYKAEAIRLCQDPGKLRIWLQKTQPLLPFNELSFDISNKCSVFSSRTNILYVIDPKGEIFSWDVESGYKSFFSSGHSGIKPPLDNLREDKLFISNDGGRLCSYGTDRIIRVWDTKTKTEIFSSLALLNGLEDFRFSGDGKKLLTISKADSSEYVMVWDIAANKKTLTILHNLNSVVTAMFSPNSQYLMTAWTYRFMDSQPVENRCQVWNLETGEKAGPPFRFEKKAVFSPDGSKLLTGNSSGIYSCFDVFTGQEKFTDSFDSNYDNDFNGFFFTSDGKKIINASDIASIKIINSETGNPVCAPILAGTRSIIATCQKSDSVIYCLQGSRIFGYSIDTGKQLDSSLELSDDIHSIHYDSSSKKIFGLGKSLLTIWNTQYKDSIETISINRPDMGYAGFNKATKAVFLSGPDFFQTWKFENLGLVNTIFMKMGPIRSVMSNRANSSILVSSQKGAVILHLESGKQDYLRGSEQKGAITSAIYSPKENYIVTTSNDGSVQIWDSKTLKPFNNPIPHDAPVLQVAFSSDESILATLFGKGKIDFWDVATQQISEDIRPYWYTSTTGNHMVNFIQLSKDNKTLLIAASDSTAWLIDLQTGQPIGDFFVHKGKINTAVFSPDGKKILTASDDSTAQVWDIVKRRITGPVLKHNGKVNSAFFNLNGDEIITACSDGSSQVWDAETGEHLGDPMIHNDAVNMAIFLGNGEKFVTAGNDGSIKFWDTPADLDIPKNLFALHIEYTVDRELDFESLELTPLSQEKEEQYHAKSDLHLEECKYKKYNLLEMGSAKLISESDVSPKNK